jgi:hypothetical protein
MCALNEQNEKIAEERKGREGWSEEDEAEWRAEFGDDD